jgi:hypothetical protein
MRVELVKALDQCTIRRAQGALAGSGRIGQAQAHWAHWLSSDLLAERVSPLSVSLDIAALRWLCPKPRRLAQLLRVGLLWMVGHFV